ncbi:hypothetical protein P170DRAFT_425778 [Aspergillus steynii IBT 23096]|uniref:Uncharacterized protein n=1 Tax=Aspergillus steynii IBT 23096 TaxID=1392250 RepID=A0A2I2G797_9EURO|nr:uncharacterized protein P170DRAFT_425778 [Aspergillus steynii IBT 23096]PLB48754.1 hypothetical protein P170DRAFT_425778 [Aspergillus steynii IBT 23096]
MNTSRIGSKPSILGSSNDDKYPRAAENAASHFGGKDRALATLYLEKTRAETDPRNVCLRKWNPFQWRFFLNRHLADCLEPKVFRSRDSTNEAMIWACRSNNLDLIRRAVLNGACGLEGRKKVFTLYLALARGHMEAFKLLLDLGSWVDGPGVDKVLVRRLKKRSRLPCHTWDFLPLCLDKGFDEQARDKLGLPSIPILVCSGAPIELIEMLLDKGADPSELHTKGRFKFIGALSTAIRGNSIPLMRLLLTKGADIYGKDIGRPQKRISNIPIFAAAEVIVKHGLEPMQFCLDNGADINQNGCEYAPSEIWDETQHAFNYRTEIIPAPSCLDLLFAKWGLSQLAVPTFLETVKFLIQHEASSERLAKVLSLCDYDCEPDNDDTAKFKAAWHDMLTVACNNAYFTSSTFLAQYILFEGKESSRKESQELAYMTIDHLLAVGADINARTGPNGSTGLYSLCEYYASLCWTYGYVLTRKKREFV